MARKKPMQYVPREERPEFLALVAELANVQPEQFAGLAMQYAEKYHDAVLAGHVEVLDQMESAYGALVYKLNGETMMGCMADADSAGHVLARAVAAKPGQVPRWGQAGEFLLEVEGVRVWVVMTDDMLGNHRACDLHAVDLDKPFISETGYRSAGLTVTSSLGDTVDQSARRMVLDVMKSEGRLKAIKADAWARSSPKKRPGWLVDALAGVRPDGQLAMFGDAPKDPEAKAPLSNAERQRRHRQRLNELADTEGLKAIRLTRTDRMVLSLGLLAHEDLHHRPKDWATTKKPGFDSLLVKLWPEGDNGRYLAEPNRSTYRPAAFLRDQLERTQTENQRLKSALHEIAAEMGAVASVPAKGVQGQANGDFSTLEVTDARLLPVWETLPSDFARAATALGLLRLRNNQHAELVCAVEVLQSRLSVAGLSDRVTDNKEQWYWNPVPHQDYRVTSAPESMERISRSPSVADKCAELERELAAAKREMELLETERNKAFSANRTLTERLRRAGLSTDYRPQAGE